MKEFIKTERGNICKAICVVVLTYLVQKLFLTIDASNMDKIVDKTFSYGVNVSIFALTLLPVTLSNLRRKVIIKGLAVSFIGSQTYLNIITFYGIIITINIIVTIVSMSVILFGINKISIEAVRATVALTALSIFLFYKLTRFIIAFLRLKEAE